MAVREHLKCPACGSQRQRQAYGIDRHGDYDRFLPGPYEVMLYNQTIGGRGKCEWTYEDLPHGLALAMRKRLHFALRKLEIDLEAGGAELEPLD